MESRLLFDDREYKTVKERRRSERRRRTRAQSCAVRHQGARSRANEPSTGRGSNRPSTAKRTRSKSAKAISVFE
ncbi:MAG: hypothetical protein DMG04_18780 [Acidobacteria bacterium]|nr:MAG: hypothetical protein DMG04_18780 [Acidobacteriota bacterium]PYR08444.1 MAG: hypothetical protein DMF99_19170 [Acidobacteriota bacterium]